jgi:tetratricopeptide (TPR) repeat protein
VLATGELPFQAETTMGILMALATHEPAPPRRLVPTIPKALSRLILSLLEKRSADRPLTASEVITLLADLDADPAKPATDAAIAPGEPPPRPAKLSADASEPTRSAAGKRAPRKRKQSSAAATGAPTRTATYAIVGLIGLGLLACVVPLAGIGAYYAFFGARQEPDPGVEGPRNAPPPGPLAEGPGNAPPPGPVVGGPRNAPPPVPEVPAEPTGEVPAGWVVVRSSPATVTVAMPQQPEEEAAMGMVKWQTKLANGQKLTIAVQRLHPAQLALAGGREGVLDQIIMTGMMGGRIRPGGNTPDVTRIKVGPWPGRQCLVPAPPIKQGGYLGVVMRSGPGGVLIQGVAPYTPAAEAGLKVDDVIFEADGQPIPDQPAMANALNAHKPGDTMRLKVKRGPAQLEVNVTLTGRVIDQCMRVYLIDNHVVLLSGPARRNGPAPETVPFFKSLKLGSGDEARAKFDKAQVHAARGEWKAAAAEYARVLAAQPLDGGFIGFEYAAVLLLSGDQAGYRKVCAELLAKSDQVEFRPYHAARACTLAPDSVSDATLPGKTAALELKRNATEFWSLTQQGALACRASRYDEAEALLKKSLAANPRVGAQVVSWAWLALLEHRRGNAGAARTWVEKATKGLEEYPPGVPVLTVNAKDLHLHNWLEAQVLRREVEALLATKKP